MRKKPIKATIPHLSTRLAISRRSRLGPRVGALLSVVLGAVAGFLINLATAGGHSWLIPVLAVLAIALWAIVEFLRSGEPNGIALAEWLRSQIDSYRAASWINRPIELLASRQGGPPITVRPAVESWVDEGPGRVLVLTGNFGSGKTWTMRWLAQRLAERWLRGDRTSPVPVLIGLTQLSDCNTITREQILQLAWPTPLSDVVLRSGRSDILLLLDGLDELISLDGSDAQAKKILNFIAAMEPPSTRFMISCRTEAITSEPALGDLAALLAKVDSADQTAWAVMKAVNPERTALEQIRILDVPEERADSYLLQSEAASSWEKVRTEIAYKQLARVPFTIYLLQEALPRLNTPQSDTTLPLLYLKAVESWLLRSGRPPEEVDEALSRLESLALAMLFQHTMSQMTEIDESLRRAGILVHQPSSTYAFRHYSLAEYFLCRIVVRQMAQYSSALLSRLDLIYANSMNRFLIPMLRTEFEKPSPSPENTETGSRLVTFKDFRKFMTLTGWRSEGYGTWVSLRCADGTSPWEGQSTRRQQRTISDVFVEEEAATSDSPVTGISWYDAFQYCRWSGGRLATANELTTLRPLAGDYDSEWSSSWYKESAGLMSVVRTESGQRQPAGSARSPTQTEGLNPDLRLRGLSFRIICP